MQPSCMVEQPRDSRKIVMSQLKTISRFTTFIFLSGVTLPCIVVIWAAAFRNIYDAFLITTDEYAMIALAAWSAALFHGWFHPDTRDLVKRANIRPMSFRNMRLAAIIGMILSLGGAGFFLLFRVGYGIFPFLFLPLVFSISIIALEFHTRLRQQFSSLSMSRSLYTGLAIATMAAAPAYFEGIKGYGGDFIVNPCIWYIGIYLGIVFFCRDFHLSKNRQEFTRTWNWLNVLFLSGAGFLIWNPGDCDLHNPFFPFVMGISLLAVLIVTPLLNRFPTATAEYIFGALMIMPAAVLLIL